MKTRIATLVVLIGLGGVFWVTTEAIAPTKAWADTARRVDLSLDRQPNETYESLVRRAETAATAAAQSSFNQDAGVADVSVMVVAQNQGAIAPVLSLQVSRTEWDSRPDTQRWGRYFSNAKVLLKFENVATKTDAQAGTANPATTFGGSTNSYPRQSGANRFNSNGYPGQTGNTNSTFNRGRPTSGIFGPANLRERNNGYPGQAGTAIPSTSGQPTNSYPGQSGIPNTIIPSQTPAPGSGMTPQPAVAAPGTNLGNPQTTTQPNNSIPGVPSTTVPGNLLPTPVAPQPSSGSTLTNPASTSFPR